MDSEVIRLLGIKHIQWLYQIMRTNGESFYDEEYISITEMLILIAFETMNPDNTYDPENEFLYRKHYKILVDGINSGQLKVVKGVHRRTIPVVGHVFDFTGMSMDLVSYYLFGAHKTGDIRLRIKDLKKCVNVYDAIKLFTDHGIVMHSLLAEYAHRYSLKHGLHEDKNVTDYSEVDLKVLDFEVLKRFVFSKLGTRKGTKKDSVKAIAKIFAQRELDRRCTCDHLQLTGILAPRIINKVKADFDGVKPTKKNKTWDEIITEYVQEAIIEVFKDSKNEGASSRIKYDNKNWVQPKPCKEHTG